MRRLFGAGTALLALLLLAHVLGASCHGGSTADSLADVPATASAASQMSAPPHEATTERHLCQNGAAFGVRQRTTAIRTAALPGLGAAALAVLWTAARRPAPRRERSSPQTPRLRARLHVSLCVLQV
ncbi:hypothetical protein [Allosalinactinospora lopnorensis]|uniref:hypothetical protein n=1 Tax=Allosalinactinospora lopnorensis TaxID=1352348 RepID=UPI0012E0E24E|nr:hypothetical protein [Allosalinactinospora lopnorensis]